MKQIIAQVYASSIAFTEIRICISIQSLWYVVMELERITTNLYYIRAQSLARISFHKPRRDRSWIRIHAQSLWWVDRDLWHGVRYRLCRRRELPSESILPFCCRTLEICDIPKETIKTSFVFRRVLVPINRRWNYKRSRNL